MRPLTYDDLLPLEDFAGQRRELFEAHIRYVDRYRRVRFGPRLALIFENRQTLWFRVQEILRWRGSLIRGASARSWPSTIACCRAAVDCRPLC